MAATGDENRKQEADSKDGIYYVYMIRCEDGSLYTGITTDVKRRFSEHLAGGKKGAKYTKVHKPKEIAAVFETDSKSEALGLEYSIKQLTKEEKENLIRKEGFNCGKEADFCKKNK